MESIHKEERNKRLRLFLNGFLLIIIFAIILNRSWSIRVPSDLFSQWFVTSMSLKEGCDLYDVQNGREVSQFKTIPTTALDASFFYPAHLLIFISPLALLPFLIAHLFWTIGIQLFFLLGTWVVVKRLGWHPTANQMAVFFYCQCCLSLLTSTLLGVNLIRSV